MKFAPIRSVCWSVLFIGISLSGCGGGGSGGGGGGPSGPATADFTVMDSTADGLLSFSAKIQSLRVVNSVGIESANLLTGTIPIELIGLQSSQAWLTHATLAPGTLKSVKLELDPSSIVARDMSGADVPVTVMSNTLTAPFTAALFIGDTGYHHIAVDFDLAASLSGSVSSPPITLDPHGLASNDDGGSGVEIEDIRGVVKSWNAGGQTFVIDAFVDEDLAVHLGTVTVALQPAALIFNNNGSQISPGIFFGALSADHTFVEVHGFLKSGHIDAETVKIEDQSGGSSSVNQVKIEGLITALGPGSTFGLLIQNIEKGASIAEAVLATLGDPAEIDVQYDGSTVFSIEHAQVTTSAALAVGQRVQVEFPVFANSPFLAAEVEIEDGPEFEGHITSIAGLPSTLVIHLDPDSPAISSGQVATSSTNVTVQMGSSPLFLDTSGHPALQSSQLLNGLRLEVHGAISGFPVTPSIAANEVKIKPGRFRGNVFAIDPATSSFMASVTVLEDPFGDNVTVGPFTVHIAPGCVFKHQANSAASFFDLYNTLPINRTLEVRVKGIGSGAANEVAAYEIEAEEH